MHKKKLEIKNKGSRGIVVKNVSTGYPVVSKLIAIIVILSIIASFDKPAWLLYAFLFIPMWYGAFCRYSCKVVFNTNTLEIKYLNPFLKTKSFKVSDIHKIDYERSTYHFLSDKKIGGMLLPHYPYDRLIIFLNSPGRTIVEVNVNTQVGQFKKILKLAFDMGFLVK